MRKFIDKEEMLANVIELDNDWGHSVYCVLEDDIADAPDEEAIDIDWIVDYVDGHLSTDEANVIKRMVGVWYEEYYADHNMKKKKPTLTEAFTKGFDAGSRAVKKEFVSAVKWMQEELQKRAKNGEQKEESTDTAVQE